MNNMRSSPDSAGVSDESDDGCPSHPNVAGSRPSDAWSKPTASPLKCSRKCPGKGIPPAGAQELVPMHVSVAQRWALCLGCPRRVEIVSLALTSSSVIVRPVSILTKIFMAAIVA